MTSEKVTPDPLAARVHALIAQWRELAENLAPYATALNTPYAVTWLKRCANELEAALAAALAPPHEFVAMADVIQGGSEACAVCGRFEPEHPLAAALAPNSEKEQP